MYMHASLRKIVEIKNTYVYGVKYATTYIIPLDHIWRGRKERYLFWLEYPLGI